MLRRCLAIAALAVPLSLTLAPSGLAQDDPIPVIISTDASTGLANGWLEGASEIDDGLAIAMALALPELDVRVVVATWGNNLIEPEAEVARRIVLGMGTDIPVLHGAPRPLPEYPVTLYDGSPVNSACLNEGVRFMAAELVASAEPVTLLAIGPLTDVACLALNYPSAAGKIARVVVVGGRSPDEALEINGILLADFNLALDIAALRHLLEETSLPLQFMPLGLTSSVLVPANDRRVLCRSDLPLAADYFCPGVRPWIDTWHKTFKENGFHPWDQNAVYAVARPDAFACTPASAKIVDCAKQQCAGQDADHPTVPVPETAQLWLSPDAKATRISVCNGYAEGGREAFLDAIFAFAK